MSNEVSIVSSRRNGDRLRALTVCIFFFSSRRRHTRSLCDWSSDVCSSDLAKMVARHPHVFGDQQVANAEEVLRNWERRKAEEAEAAGRSEETPLDRVPVALPALAWTNGMQKREIGRASCRERV